MFKSIKTKLLTVQIGFVLVMALVLGVVTDLIMFKSLKSSRLQYLDYVELHVEQEIDKAIDTREQLLEKIASSEVVANYTKKRSENILLGYFGKFMSEFNTLSYVSEQGIEEVKLVEGRASDDVLDEAESELVDWLKRNPNKVANKYLAFSPEMKDQCIEFGILKKNFFDEFVCIILAKVSVSNLVESLYGINVGETGSVILIDSGGTILFSREPSSINKKIVIEGVERETVEVIKAGGSGFGRAKILGVDSYFAYGGDYKQDWTVIVVLPYKEFAAELRSLRSMIFLVGFNVLIAGTVLSLIIAKGITKPISTLVEATEIVARGEFVYKINISSQDEIGTLARSFNRMSDELGKTTTSITDLNQEVAVRKKVEASLRNSERRFEEIAENSGDWIWEVNAEGLYIYSNSVVEKILGYRPAEIIGKNHFYDFFVPKEKEELKKDIFEGFAKHEEFHGFVNFNIHKDGSTVILETNATPVVDDQGKLLGYRGADRDITSRKRAEQQLLSVNELQKLLLQPVSVERKLKFVTDSVVRTIDADFARIWMIKPGDLCDSGCKHAETAEGPHVCRFRDKCLHLMASSGRYTHIDGEVHRRVPFGCYKIGKVAAGDETKFLTNEVTTDPRVHNHEWAKELGLVSFAGYRLMHTDGKHLGVLALFSKHPISPEQDALLEGIAHVTSMVIHASRTENALSKSEEFAKRVVESSSDCIKVLDLQGNLLSMNDGGQKLMEIDDIAPYLNKSFIDFWEGRERKDCLDAVEKAKRGGTGIFYGYHDTAKGSGKSWEVIITPIRDADGTISSLLATSRDITERKQAEQRRIQLLEKLEKTNRELNEFVYIASHDLRTPLRGIATLANWISTDFADKLDQEGKRKISLLSARVNRMYNMLMGILQYSKLARTGEEEVMVDLNQIVTEIADAVNLTDKVKITIESKLPAIKCEKTPITQVFVNLIGNAVKYMDKPRGWVSISCVEENGFWKFSVADNGPGINEKYHEKIFKIFQTLAQHDEVDNIGMGLALVKKVVEMHDGKVWIESKLGQGSTFFFTLPKKQANAEAEKVEVGAVS